MIGGGLSQMEEKRGNVSEKSWKDCIYTHNRLVYNYKKDYI